MLLISVGGHTFFTTPDVFNQSIDEAIIETNIEKVNTLTLNANETQYETNEIEALTVNDTLFKGNPSTEDLLNYYSTWAQSGKYDEHLSSENGYRGPEVAANAAATLYERTCRRTVRVLDVAAGTGHVAQELRDIGFANIDALDPSESMLLQARKKNLYNNYICDFLTEDAMPDYNGWYDCITSSGGFGQGHIPAEALYDLIRLTRKGGYIILVMREEYVYMDCYNEILEPLMKKLENENKWKMLGRTIIPGRERTKTKTKEKRTRQHKN